ncbi:hypothetical protein HDV06_006944 [Boothiomyces sp. JEL0866]|nr:hypothetical protein HDV06_006944 [Boothiomyces sp. JEL0866]
MTIIDTMGSQFQSGYDLSITPDIQIWLCIWFMATSVGCIGSLLVIISSLRQNINASMLLLLSLTCADFMYSAHVWVNTIQVLYHHQYAFGKTGCTISHVIAMISAMTSGCSLVLITVERYLAIFYKQYLTVEKSCMWLIILWILGFLVALVPVFTGNLDDALALSPSKMYCSFAYTNHDPKVLLGVILALSILGVNVQILTAGYYQIVSFYIQQNNQTKSKKKLSDREKQLIKKAVVICLTYIFCWTPLALVIVYEEVTLKVVDPNLDAFCGLMTVMNGALNPYLLIIMDGRIKQNVYALLNIEYKESSTLGKDASNTLQGVEASKITRVQELTSQIPSTMLLLSLSVADFLYSGHILILSIINLYYKYYSFGTLGCKINYFIAMFAAICSGMSLVLITMERYLAIFYKQSLTMAKACRWVIFTWIASTLVTLLPAYTGVFDESLSLGSTKLYCTFAFTNHQPIVFWSVITVLSILGINVNILTMGYYKIVSFYIQQNNQTKSKKRLSEREKDLIKKAVAICFTYISCWTPLALAIIYQEATQKPVSVAVDGITCLISMINSALNPYLLIAMDGRIKQNVYSLLNIQFETSSSILKDPSLSIQGMEQSQFAKTVDLAKSISENQS